MGRHIADNIAPEFTETTTIFKIHNKNSHNNTGNTSNITKAFSLPNFNYSLLPPNYNVDENESESHSVEFLKLNCMVLPKLNTYLILSFQKVV